MQTSGASIICRAVELDNSNRFMESLICYQEGIQILLNVCKDEADKDKAAYLRSKVQSYMSRAEVIKTKISELKKSGQYHELIKIKDGAVGYSYDTVFNKFLDEDVTHILIEDPYIRAFHQFQNLVRLNECFLKYCKGLKQIKLITTKNKENGFNQEQDNNLLQIKNDLNFYQISFTWEYSSTLHDRQIALSTGWMFKLGRGLDFYKPASSKLSIGSFDLNFRRCHESTIDIFHKSSVKMS